jgi:hypothetical protein
MSSESETPRRTGAGLFDWVFRNRRTGRITIGQRPNLSLWVFLVSAAVEHFVTDDTPASSVLGWIAEVALAAWAVDEVLRGVNPWRRALGLAGCALVAARLVALVH